MPEKFLPGFARKRDGFGEDPNNKKYTRVSGILAVDHLDPFSIDYREITLWHNPFAKNLIPSSDIPFRQKTMSNPEIPHYNTIPPQQPSFEILKRIL